MVTWETVFCAAIFLKRHVLHLQTDVLSLAYCCHCFASVESGCTVGNNIGISIRNEILLQCHIRYGMDTWNCSCKMRRKSCTDCRFCRYCRSCWLQIVFQHGKKPSPICNPTKQAS